MQKFSHFVLYLGPLYQNASLLKSPTIHTVYHGNPFHHCLQASFQNNKYQLWLANYVFEIYFLIEVYTVVGDTLYCTTMYCIYALQ